ncbi:MAG: effector binding domain-containing protein [Oscillospiraceae bacterium]|nr:effector binding domain-containing protein [Oscillospiraceae bacterium]
MELQTISQVSKNYGISVRMLRYYEQAGLIQSIRNEENSYRFYDETALKQLNSIILLRKLRISVKQIKEILNNQNAQAIVGIFEQNISELDEEITSLSTIKTILARFVDELRAQTGMTLQLDLLNAANSIFFSKNLIKEKVSMEDLNKAEEKLNKLTDRDVRIIYLPPATVASAHYIGDTPEWNAAAMMDKFVLENDLPNIYPDMRQFGFNHPNAVDETNYHGYEFWVTIPDDLEVPEPLTKKKFAGGLYAAHMIPMGAFEEWEWLSNWVGNSKKYDYNMLDDGGECMYGLLEEHLNYRNNVATFVNGRYDNIQLDLLFPIKPK